MELTRTLSQVSSWEEWEPAWSQLSSDHQSRAREALQAGNGITAGEFFQRAALATHFSRIAVDQDEHIQRHLVELYREAAPLIVPPAQRLDFDTEVATVPGYLRVPPGNARPGLVVLLPGLDSVKEQLGVAWEPYFLKRGLATLSIEGPGQGELATCPFRDESYHTAVAGVARSIEELEGVDAARVVVVGISLGGYLALRNGPMLQELVGLRGIVDFGGRYKLEAATGARHGVVIEGYMRLTGARDEGEVRDALAGASLAGVLAKITTPVLVAHGGQDPIVPVEDAKRIAAELGARATLYIEAEGNHNINTHHVISRPLVADWAVSQINGV